MNLNEMRDEAHENSKEKGFWPGLLDADDCANAGIRANRRYTAVDEQVPLKLMLIVTEVAEAMECYREDVRSGDPPWWQNRYEKNGKPVGFASEIADVLIRLGDLAGALGIDLEQAVREKMDYNKNRSFKHGGKAV